MKWYDCIVRDDNGYTEILEMARLSLFRNYFYCFVMRSCRLTKPSMYKNTFARQYPLVYIIICRFSLEMKMSWLITVNL